MLFETLVVKQTNFEISLSTIQKMIYVRDYKKFNFKIDNNDVIININNVTIDNNNKSFEKFSKKIKK